MTQHYVGTKIILAWEQEKDGKPGYAVKYADGYTSWSPKETFEQAYIAIGNIPANIEPHVERLIGERAQLHDRTEKLREFYREAEDHEDFKLLQGNEIEDIADQIPAMVEYRAVLDQRLRRHGFVFHETGKLFTVKQAQYANRASVEDIIVDVIAEAEKAGVLLDIAAGTTMPEKISSAIARDFDIHVKVTGSFENEYWTFTTEANEVFGEKAQSYIFRRLECYHRSVDKYIADAIKSAYGLVSEMGTAPNDVVFLSYLVTHFTKKFGNTVKVSLDGRRINGNWQLVVTYVDELLKGETFYYTVFRFADGRVAVQSENSRQDRFTRALDSMRTFFPPHIVEAILDKLEESIASVDEVGRATPTLTVSRGEVSIIYKDEALERLHQMVAAAANKLIGGKA